MQFKCKLRSTPIVKLTVVDTLLSSGKSVSRDRSGRGVVAGSSSKGCETKESDSRELHFGDCEVN